MKTAKQYLEELQSKGGELADTIEDNTEEFLSILKAYAKQVAEQALVDASENAEIDGYQYGDDSVSWIDKNSIINTPIQLP